jgi:serine/threonine protein kinase
MAQKEIELMKCLKHKNIVRWIDDFRSNGIWFIVLEYCGKGDLQKYKEKISKIPEHHCKALIRGILEALIELHS